MGTAFLFLQTPDVVAYDDPRMVRTVDAIGEELDSGGLPTHLSPIAAAVALA